MHEQSSRLARGLVAGAARLVEIEGPHRKAVSGSLVVVKEGIEIRLVTAAGWSISRLVVWSSLDRSPNPAARLSGEIDATYDLVLKRAAIDAAYDPTLKRAEKEEGAA